METPNGTPAPERPYNVIGYREHTDEHGNVTLWARRSPLDIAPVAVVVNMVIVKKLAALYCAVEADQQLAMMGLHVLISDTGTRELAGVVQLGSPT